MGNYELESQIGSGSFSVVWRAKHIHHHGDIYAIKEIGTRNICQKLRESLISEIDILKKIKHRNIIRLFDALNDQDTYFLVLEYCNGGDLFSYSQRCGRFSEAVARDFIIQLAAGLKVLRENNLIHRDLKPQNLLLSINGENTVLKIADFGFARLLQPQGLAETICGSPLYMAPEIMLCQKYDAKADLWSVGTILFQLLTGRPPYCGVSPIDLMQNIMKSDELQLFPSDIVGHLNPDCVDLCKKLLRRNPAERLSFQEFFSHRFMVEPIRSMVRHENSTEGSGDSHDVENSEVSQAHCLETLVNFKEDYFNLRFMVEPIKSTVGHENRTEGLGDNLVVENSEVSQDVVNFEKELVDTASRKGVIDSIEDCIDEEDVFLDGEEYVFVDAEEYVLV